MLMCKTGKLGKSAACKETRGQAAVTKGGSGAEERGGRNGKKGGGNECGEVEKEGRITGVCRRYGEKEWGWVWKLAVIRGQSWVVKLCVYKVCVCVRVCARVCEPHCGQHSVTDRHRVPLPSECAFHTVHSCVCKLYFKVAEWIFRWYFISPAYLLGASTKWATVTTSEQKKKCI